MSIDNFKKLADGIRLKTKTLKPQMFIINGSDIQSGSSHVVGYQIGYEPLEAIQKFKQNHIATYPNLEVHLCLGVDFNELLVSMIDYIKEDDDE